MQSTVVSIDVAPLLNADEKTATEIYEAFLKSGEELYRKTNMKVTERVQLSGCQFGLHTLTRLPLLIKLIRKGVAATHSQQTVLVLKPAQRSKIMWIYEQLTYHLPSVASCSVVFEIEEC